MTGTVWQSLQKIRTRHTLQILPAKTIIKQLQRSFHE